MITLISPPPPHHLGVSPVLKEPGSSEADCKAAHTQLMPRMVGVSPEKRSGNTW